MKQRTLHRWPCIHIWTCPERRRGVVCCLMLSLLLTPVHASAADDATLVFRPHCIEEEWENRFGGPMPDIPQTITPGSGRCPLYPTHDPLTQETPVRDIGELLDLDIILKNPASEPIQRIRVWLSYDPEVLEGVSIETNPRFPVITPGEADFAIANGTVQIGIRTEGEEGERDEHITVARVQFRVKSLPAGGTTALAFQDIRKEADGHTVAVRGRGSEEVNVLAGSLTALLVRLKEPAKAATSSSASSSSIGTSSSAASTAASLSPPPPSVESERTSFVLLQVQSLRAATEGSSVFLAWDHLRSSELLGYNVYYGTEPGRYIHRRSVPGGTNTLTVRALPLDTRYYFAVRAVNKKNEESAFSQEVAITVGDPRSSSALLKGTIAGAGPQGKNPLKTPKRPMQPAVPGETGAPSWIALLLIASAIIGTGFAFRRQIIATPARP